MVIFDFIRLLLRLYSFVLLARVLLSWFPNVDYSNPIIQFLYDITEPVLQPVRDALRRQFPNAGPIDFSPLLVFLGISVLLRLLPPG